MPPKKTKRASTPPSTSKKRAKHGNGQPSIDAFFTSPSKKSQANGSVISISDDEEDAVPHKKASISSKVPKIKAGRSADSKQTGSKQIAKDELLARDLSRQWTEEEEKLRVDKGKQRENSNPEEDGDDEGIEVVDVPASESPRINGSSSSKHKLPERQTSPSRPPKPKLNKGSKSNVPLAPVFGNVKTESSPDKVTQSVKDELDMDTEIKPKLRDDRGDPSSPLRELEDTKPDIKPAFSLKSNGNTNGAISSTSTDAVEPIDFDVDAFTFRPEEVDVSKWPKGRLPYSVLVGVYVQVSSTRSRLMIVRVLTNFLHLLLRASPIDLQPTMYLLSNHLLPSYLPSELGIGSQILSKAVYEVSGLQSRDMKKLWEKWGDPGDVAFEAKSNLRTLIKPSPLLVGDVYKRLLSLVKIKGPQSGKIKGDVVRKLMVQARGEEVRFLVRSLVGNLRIGAVRLTLLTSLARATALHHCAEPLIRSVLPIPPTPSKPGPGQKRQPRPKPQPDHAREEVEAICVEAVKLVRKVHVRHPNYGDLVKGIADGGLDGLENRVPVSVGIPLSPMLGSITRSLSDVFTRLGTLPFTAEAKLDGQRVQVHARRHGPQGEDDGGGRWVQNDEGDKIWVRLFSRHLEDMTEKYPDICQMVLALLLRPLPSDRTPFPSSASPASTTMLDMLNIHHVDSFIMDAEVVAIDKTTGAYRTFQELTNRAKKDVRVEDIKVVVGIFAFDLMLLNDQPLLASPFSHRRHILRTLFPRFSPPDPLIARFFHVECLDSLSCTDVTAEMQAFFETVVEQKCEGLMVKLLESGEGITGDDEEPEEGEDGDGAGIGGKKKKGTGGKKKPLPATYEPDQRSQGWLKVKKDYLEGLGDSLDLVPVGAWWGTGRKAGWWSPILLACHNTESGALEAVCKCISGFTDQFYKDLTARYPPHNAIPEKCSTDNQLSYCDTGGLRPDVWFSPDEVWEIRGADITLSPVYPAAASLLGSERGLSIRFPRFMKLREDKTWEQATTSDQFADMYRTQIREAPARKAAETDEPQGGVKIRKAGSEEAEVDGEGEGGDDDGEEGDGEEMAVSSQVDEEVGLEVGLEDG